MPEFLSVFSNPDYNPDPDQTFHLANFEEDDVVVKPLDESQPVDDAPVADTPTEQASAPASTEGE